MQPLLAMILSIILSGMLTMGCEAPENIDAGLIVEAPAAMAGMEAWNSTIHVFKDGECAVLESLKFSDVKSWRTKEKGVAAVTVVSDTSNIEYYPGFEGYFRGGYYVRVKNPAGDIPEILAGCADIGRGGRMAPVELKRVTSSLSVKCVDAPEEFKGVSLSLGRCADAFYIYDSCAGVVENMTDTVLEFGPEGGEKVIMPMAGNSGKAEISAEISIGDKKFCPSVSVSRICGNQKLSVMIDFSRLDAEHRFKLLCEVSDPESGEELSSAETVVDAEELFVLPLVKNSHYQVQVQNATGRWQGISVHDALCSNAAKHGQIWNDWNNDKALRDTMSYAIFEAPAGGPVNVRVKKLSGAFSSAEVRPSPYGIVPKNIGDNTIEFTLPSIGRGKVSVEFDGDRQHNLFLFGYEPDENKPDRNDPQVKYYGPGEHDLGTSEIRLYDNQTLYIDYGAKVYGKVRIVGNNVTVAGHGILSGERLKHWGEKYYACGEILIDTATDKKGLRFNDITIIDSPSWNFRIMRHNDVVIDGINMISWILNGDGIDLLSCHDVDIKNCFLRSYDDAITLKVRQIPGKVPDLYNVHIHDCIIYSDFARGIVIGPEAGNLEAGTGYIHDVTVEDCWFLNHGGGTDQSDIRAAFAIGQYARYIYTDGSATAIENVTARNLVFDSIGRTGMNVSVIQDSEQTTPCVMKNILFENFVILDKNKVVSPAFYIRNNQNSIEGMTVRNCVFDGTRITGEGAEFEIYGTGKVDIKFE